MQPWRHGWGNHAVRARTQGAAVADGIPESAAQATVAVEDL
jgi:hypothetical protein